MTSPVELSLCIRARLALDCARATGSAHSTNHDFTCDCRHAFCPVAMHMVHHHCKGDARPLRMGKSSTGSSKTLLPKNAYRGPYQFAVARVLASTHLNISLLRYLRNEDIASILVPSQTACLLRLTPSETYETIGSYNSQFYRSCTICLIFCHTRWHDLGMLCLCCLLP